MVKFRGSLLTRTTLTFVFSAMAAVVVALLVVNTFVVSPLLKQASAAKAASIEIAANTYFELPVNRRADFELKLLVNQGLLVSPIQQEMAVAPMDAEYFRLLETELEKLFRQDLEFFQSEDHLWVNIPNTSGSDLQLQIGLSSELPYATQRLLGFLALVVAALVAVVASFLLVRRIVSFIQSAVEATSSFRGTGPFASLEVEGPKELRELASSLNQMAQNVVELLENRTALLAGISHDLRTPLTRLTLAVELHSEKLGPEVTEQFIQDLEQLNVLISNALEYAQGTQETVEVVPFRSLLTSLVDGLDAGIDIEWIGNQQLELSLAPGAFSRVITNLIENASYYGKRTSVKVVVEDELVVVHVMDDGPGIPVDEHEKVFRPFYRLDTARGGKCLHSGLGLAIVKQLCETYGWRVSISEEVSSGTDVCVEIPYTRLSSQ